jgi:hypothetical protein
MITACRGLQLAAYYTPAMNKRRILWPVRSTATLFGALPAFPPFYFSPLTGDFFYQVPKRLPNPAAGSTEDSFSQQFVSLLKTNPRIFHLT